MTLLLNKITAAGLNHFKAAFEHRINQVIQGLTEDILPLRASGEGFFDLGIDDDVSDQVAPGAPDLGLAEPPTPEGIELVDDMQQARMEEIQERLRREGKIK